MNRRYSQPLPLLIELRDYNRWDCKSGKGFPRYLHEASTWHRLNQHTLDWLLKQPGRVLLLLDGLDEVFDPVEREQVVNDIHRFSNDYPDTRILVTSRVIGYKAERLRDAGFRDHMLQDLDDKVQIPQFLERWHQVTFNDPNEAAPKRERLARAIRDSRPIAQLAGNPLLLTLMAIVNRYQELPRDRALLYEKAAEVLLQQWDTERGLQDFPNLSREIDLRAKTAILQRVATRMQTGDEHGGEAANIIQGEALIELIEHYLCEELRFTQARAAAQALVRQLRERNFILCFLGADSYAFVHRTFLEYSCAADHVQRFHKEKSLTIKGLIEVFDRHCRDDDWREVLRLICGQIDEEFVGQVVECLSGRFDWAAWNGVDETPEVLLAVQCLGEAKALLKLEHAGTVLMKTLVRWIERVKNHDLVFDFWLTNAIPACREIGDRWPGKQAIYQFNPSEQHFLSIGRKRVDEPWVSLLAAVDFNAEFFAKLTANEHEFIRASSVWHLGQGKPDPNTRRLLSERTVKDVEGVVRTAALAALTKTWPDANTRRLLAARAVQDDDDGTRGTALAALADTWPDADTRRLLAQQAPMDGAAACVLGKEHSRLGEILFTSDCKGFSPYLDPREPLPREHIEKSAQDADIPPAELDATLSSLSAHMGWDILRGSRPAEK